MFTLRIFQDSPIPQAWGPPVVGSPRLLIQYIRCYPPYWWLFQPGDRFYVCDRQDFVSGLEANENLSENNFLDIITTMRGYVRVVSKFYAI